MEAIEGMRIYVSGPMTGVEDYNFPAFEAAAKRLRSLGHHVVTPHELDAPDELAELKSETDAGDPYGPAYERFLARDVDLLETAELDGIVCLQGWQHSRGVARELQVASDKGMKAWKFNYATGLGEPLDLSRFESVTAVEVRVVNADTGGEKGRKPQRMDLLPWDVLMRDVAPLYAAGARKYDDHNWRRGYEWSLSFAALMRHAAQFWHGEDDDEETGCSHMASVVFHALALLHFAENHGDLDDRPKAV